MSEIQEKVWGITREVVDSQFYSRHELELLAGGYCSLHYHHQRANRFIVVSADIEIIEFYGPQIKRIRLSPEMTYDVPSLVPHLFAVHRPGLVYEEYFPDRGGIVRRDDIVRLVEGGKMEVSQLQRLPEGIVAIYNRKP